MSEINDLRKLSDDKLIKRLEECSDALFNLRFQKAMQQLEEPLLIRRKKREIAQIKTLLNENKIKKSEKE
tara:strand:+ start:56 stop:265 length:210 start_codon:yes stop_codon:yes gene_type:complete